MVNTQRTYNALATFGQLSIGLQALSCLAFAVVMLITGSIFMGSRYVLVPAVVDDIVCDASCGIAVTYSFKGKLYMGTFETMRERHAYTPGDSILIRVNPAEPTTISEDLPWKTIGFGLVAGAIALGYLAWFAMNLVSDNRNMAALAGTFSFLKILVI
jgi:hypothetical protein